MVKGISPRELSDAILCRGPGLQSTHLYQEILAWNGHLTWRINRCVSVIIAWVATDIRRVSVTGSDRITNGGQTASRRWGMLRLSTGWAQRDTAIQPMYAAQLHSPARGSVAVQFAQYSSRYSFFAARDGSIRSPAIKRRSLRCKVGGNSTAPHPQNHPYISRCKLQLNETTLYAYTACI